MVSNFRSVLDQIPWLFEHVCMDIYIYVIYILLCEIVDYLLLASFIHLDSQKLQDEVLEGVSFSFLETGHNSG